MGQDKISQLDISNIHNDHLINCNSLKLLKNLLIVTFLSCFFVQANQKNLNEQLLTAVQRGDAQQVQNLLQQGANPNATLEDKDSGQRFGTALMFSPTAEITTLLADAGADPDSTGNSVMSPPLLNYNSTAQLEALLKAKADPNIHFFAEQPLMWVRSIEEADLLLNAGADPRPLSPEMGVRHPKWTGFHRNKYVRQALALSKKKDDVPTSCEYTHEVGGASTLTPNAKQIVSTRCGQRNLCMATAVCLLSIRSTPIINSRFLSIDIKPDTIYISRAYQVVCSALYNGDCPPAEDCVLDRTFLEAEIKADQPASNSSPPSKSIEGKGIR